MSKKSLYDQIAEIHGDDIASDVYNRLLSGQDVRKEIERLLKSGGDKSSETNK
ncbi:MAG: hypothetical protein RIM99_17600 [Cyclobacteriaceae bacterium]